MIRLKRAYNAPEGADGTRFLVDRLWPRGINAVISANDRQMHSVVLF